ncbi:hypothetical protein TNCV_1506001 [Trichonephila clavipes]|nr:hypothetical protein TNCV_1506001 [Trichonephila clavipes]
MGSHHFTSEMKQQLKQGTKRGESTPKKAKMISSAGKVMTSIFLDAHWIIFINYLPTGKAINSEYYDWWCRAGRGNAVKTRRVEQAVVSWPLPKNYSSRSYESSLDGAASESSNK